MISGHATKDGTSSFAQNRGADQKNYRTVQGLTLSNVGVGT